MNSIILLDFNTVSPFIADEQMRLIKGHSEVICFSPAADYWAEKHHISHHSVDEYVDSIQLRKTGYENFEIVDKICKGLNEILLEDDKFKNLFSSKEPDPFYGFYFKTKVIYDALVIRYEILSKILNHHAPHTVYYFGDRIDKRYDVEDVVWSSKVSLYDNVLEVLRETQDFQLHTFYLVDGNRSSKLTRRALIVIENFYYNFIKDFYYKVVKKAGDFLSYFSAISLNAPQNFLLISASYDWEEALRLIIRSKAGRIYYLPAGATDVCAYNGIRHYLYLTSKHWRKFVLKKSIPKGSFDAENAKYFYDKLSSDGSSLPIKDIYFKLLSSFFIRSLIETKQIYLKYFGQTKELIKKYKVAAVLGVSITEPINFMRVRAAQESGVPVCIFQHGGAGFDVQPVYFWCDVYPSNYGFLYGNAVRDHYQKFYQKNDISYVVTGSSMIDVIMRKRKKEIYRDMPAKKCLYLLNVFQRNTHYLAHKNYKSEVYLWNIHRDVVDIFARHKNWHLTLKLHPHLDVSYNPIIDYIHDNDIRNVTVVNISSADALMESSELIILDYPATGLIQALALKKDIIVFSGYFTVASDVEQRMKDMFGISSDKREFLTLIEDYLKKDNFANKNVKAYDEFLADYVTHINDGQSADRIKDGLIEIVNHKAQPHP